MDEIKKTITIEQIDEAADMVRRQAVHPISLAIILGSGLGGLADAVQDAVRISYTALPHWPVSTIAGHSGSLLLGQLEGQSTLVMQGRAHYYEGYELSQVTFPIRVMQRLGISTLIVTNAAGAVNPSYQAGDLMLIGDHLNLIGMAGLNPLRGPNFDEFGPRFPDMSCAYDRELRSLVKRVATQAKVTLHEGVYACLAGPSFETPADLRFLRTIGVDAVGMSTVPEVNVARHGGMRVLGISGISNKANLDGETITTHEEVLEAGKLLAPRMTSLVCNTIKYLEKDFTS